MKYPEEMYIGSNIFEGDMDGSESNFSEKIVKTKKVQERNTKRNKNVDAKSSCSRHGMVQLLYLLAMCRKLA